MQYLSKAYSYYSGINPATLSGAIDVIVVRHVDEMGEVTLSSSPFHVRFGKLQVLRAGEKRVTITMPNNLSPPHIAPFNMKVGDSGEAFFVLETTEEVPEDLLTSPVVMASDPTELPLTPPHSDDETPLDKIPLESVNTAESHDTSSAQATQREIITEKPFGGIELSSAASSKGSPRHDSPETKKYSGDVDFLDLNQSPDEFCKTLPHKQVAAHSDSRFDRDDPRTESSVSPSSILNTASAMLPSIPFLSHSPAPQEGPESTLELKGPVEANTVSQKQAGAPSGDGIEGQDRPKDAQTAMPRNPLTALPGEVAGLPHRDHKLSHFAHQRARAGASATTDDADSQALPKVRPGEGEGPRIVYGKDVVLDMAGYHGTIRNAQDEAVDSPLRESFNVSEYPAQFSDSGGEIAVERPKIEVALIESFTKDLLAAASELVDNTDFSTKPFLPERATDSVIPQATITSDFSEEKSSPISTYDSDMNVRETPANKQKSTSVSPSFPSRNDRGCSEPPPEVEFVPDGAVTNSSSLGLSRRTGDVTHPDNLPSKLEISSSKIAMDYAWDWGRIPDRRVHDGEVEDTGSGPLMERSPSGPFNRIGTVSSDLSRDDNAMPTNLDLATSELKLANQDTPGQLRQGEMNPFMFTLSGLSGKSHTFELSLSGSNENVSLGPAKFDHDAAAFLRNRVTVQKFFDDPQICEDPRLIVRYSLCYLSWRTAYPLLHALATYRQSLPSPGLTHSNTLLPMLQGAVDENSITRPPTGSSWSKWWRRNQVNAEPFSNTSIEPKGVPGPGDQPVSPAGVHFAKTLRLSSDQLKQLSLQPGPNGIQFSVTSSYSGLAVCTARIFLWEDTDQIVISDIDGTITKSDALGHVFAAIGRDWTHLGIAKLYTDICNNGYKIMYLTSRAIGQADSTREYLKSIIQGDYRLPEGPVIMSPDRLMASLHREVIMRKPELFKMACLRDIQRLFRDKATEAFFAGFGNRITDAMSYRSVGVKTAKIYTIDSTGVVKTELLRAAGHKGSYLALNDLVNEVFPPVQTKFEPEFTDFNYWRSAIDDISLPDLTPPSPALSARSDTSSRIGSGVLNKIAFIGRRSSPSPLLPTTYDLRQGEASSRPSSPLIGPSMTPDELSEAEEDDEVDQRSRVSSMPGSFESHGRYMPWDEKEGHADDELRNVEENRTGDQYDPDTERGEDEDSFDDGAIFDDDILAAGEMKNVPF